MGKKRYQMEILLASVKLREGKVIQAYDVLGRILEDMEKSEQKMSKESLKIALSKSAFIEHLTEKQEAELYNIIHKEFEN